MTEVDLASATDVVTTGGEPKGGRDGELHHDHGDIRRLTDA